MCLAGKKTPAAEEDAFCASAGKAGKSLKSHPALRREAFFGVCAPEHPFAGQVVEPEALLGQRLLVREAGSGTRAIFEEALRRRCYALEHFPRVTEISGFSTIKALLVENLGVSFLYATVVERELSTGTLARFDLTGEPLSGAFHLVCLRDNLFSGAWDDWLDTE